MGNKFISLFKCLESKKEMRIVMIGLDAAGKTTILFKLKPNDSAENIPTIGFNVEKIEYKNIIFTVWDIGGQKAIRHLWPHYFDNTQGLIFVIDSNDKDRIDEAKYELQKILKRKQLSEIPLLVFANKKDLPYAMSKFEIIDRLELNYLREIKWFIQPTNATNGNGLYEGLNWLTNQLDIQK